MPSLDIVSRIDFAELDNAINNTRKAIMNRFDFRNTKYEIELNKKDKKIHIQAEDDGKQAAIREMFINAAIKRGLDMKSFEFGECEPGPAGNSKRDIKLRDGLEGELAKKITKLIKESKIKVQASIQGDEVRLSGKQIDDLRSCMTLLNQSGLELPLQYVNMKS
ncbi:MAG: YajQ family cyclic di-GMP-binding protein [Phycisphaerales bacterium]|nr:YajQ family cyclic di-GMP-binding protein [Phycisphaerales bacterium]